MSIPSPGPADACGNGCQQLLRDTFRLLDLQVHISTLPPLADTDHYKVLTVVCAHGVTFYIEPTGEQRMRWSQRGRR